MPYYDNKNPSFNSTTPRFNYKKQELAAAEVPGPGSYQTRNFDVRGSRDSSMRMTSDTMAIFKDKTSRDDFKSFLPKKKIEETIPPNAYFNAERPFLKKSFNASLPPPRFV